MYKGVVRDRIDGERFMKNGVCVNMETCSPPLIY